MVKLDGWRKVNRGCATVCRNYQNVSGDLYLAKISRKRSNNIGEKFCGWFLTGYQGPLLMILFADANGFIGFSEGNAMGAQDRLTLVYVKSEMAPDVSTIRKEQ